MENFILGTAGHIDHGKSALIRALTGVETDRLEEEKKRGISIVLGYANLTLPSGVSTGIVDVPGHAKFIRTMVMGSTGINGVLLVIAADDGIMAQTKEHLLILKLLGVGLVIPVITKTDLADEETLSERENEIKKFLVSYGFENSSRKILKVSVKNNTGLNELKEYIDEALKTARKDNEPAAYEPTKVFLPVDRVISLKGFGTILAGTLKYGSFSINDEIEVMPQGYISKIKNIESHGKIVTEANKRMRIAVNVPSLEKEKIEFGNVICLRDNLLSTNLILARAFYYSGDGKNLKNHSMVSFMTGGVNTTAKIIVLNPEKKILTGNESLALFILKDTISTMFGERFIVRDIGLSKTVGGGIIIDPLADYRFEESKTNIYYDMLSGSEEDVLAGFIRLKGIYDTGLLYKKLNLGRNEFISASNKLEGKGIVITDSNKRLMVLKEEYERVRSSILKIINDFMTPEKNIFRKGIGKQELMRLTGKPEELFSLVIYDLLKSGKIISDEGYISLKKDFTKREILEMPEEIKEYAKKIENILMNQGNSVPSPAEIEKRLKINRKILNHVISIMVKDGSLIRINNDIYYLMAQFDKIRSDTLSFLKMNRRLAPGDMKQIAGVSRKYAIPLLEYFDKTGLTVKEGNFRLLRLDYKEKSKG